MTRILVGMTLCAVAALAFSPVARADEEEPGGLLGGLDIGEGPSHGAATEPPGRGQPASAEAPPRDGAIPPGGPPAPSEKPRAERSLEERIAELEKQNEALRKASADDLPPIHSIEEAQKALEALQETRRKAREDLTMADREASHTAALKRAQFEKEWKERLDAAHNGLTAEQLLSGQMPEGMNPDVWTDYCDRYFRELGELEADLAQTARSLAAKRKRELAALDQPIAQVEDVLKRWKAAPRDPALDKLHGKLMAMRALAAQREAAAVALADLKKLLAEQNGQDSGRSDEMIRMTWKSTGNLLADALSKNVLRELTLSDCHYPPRTKPDKPLEGLGDPPEWMGKDFRDNPLNRQRAKVKFLAEQLRLARQHQKMADLEVRDEDRGAVHGYARSLEQADRREGKLNDPAAQAARKAAVERYARELEASRAERIEKRRADSAHGAADCEKLLRQESAALQDMESKTRQSSAP